ncbi:MAG: class I SAM-dependent methyltransferase [Dehalococcoidia bacterium]|nr:class I SAM-dependent methyltransferase [Dehalococcoidia bacterium]
MCATARMDSAIAFKMMSLMYRIRDLLQDPRNALALARVGPGMIVADYGCGPGSFAIPAARMVGESGKVYAIDIHPLAIDSVRERAGKNGLRNVEPILVQGYDTGIVSASVDRVLLIDTIHRIDDTKALFREVHRMLKPDGLLFMHKGHLPMPEQRALVEESGLFDVLECEGLIILASPRP